MSRVEVIIGPIRRRRWSEEQKRAIVAESFAPGGTVSEVARRADICPAQIYRWRQELRAAVAGFAPVLIASSELNSVPASDEALGGELAIEPVIEVEFAGKARVRIPNSVSAELAAAVIKALSRR
ncbi:MAG: transposase [Alphaproteobacteria bacterium]|nr:transposase [Alphaproteobacteria bacterium]